MFNDARTQEQKDVDAVVTARIVTIRRNLEGAAISLAPMLLGMIILAVICGDDINWWAFGGIVAVTLPWAFYYTAKTDIDYGRDKERFKAEHDISVIIKKK